MTDPLGTDTFQGLGVPLFGESVIRQQNSSNAILTLMHSSLNAGRLLMGMDHGASSNREEPNPALSSLLTDKAVFDIDADGGFRAVSGTTVIMELNSSGLYIGDSKLISTNSGIIGEKQYSNAIDISSDGTSAYTLLSSNAGKLHIVAETSAAGYSSVVVSLPSSAATGIDVGMWWDIMCPNTSAAAVVDLALIGADHSIHCHHGSTGAVATSVAITHGSSGPLYWRVMCVTTGSTMGFVVSNMLGTNGSTNATYYGIDEGSSALS
ncbi:MAG: hypothetical protein ACXABY_19275 [Candidatus Thorarchaeota archaeon]|jgi:hypothetical protein